MQEIVNFIVQWVSQFGYMGIFIMMFLESTFFPFPSEVAMIPAGYLAAKGEMNMVAAIVVGTGGSLMGALFNYFLARKYGRKGILRFGKYFFFTESKLEKMEAFFVNHGSFSTFVSRLIPGVRQLVSLPAGLSKMPIGKFSLHTTLGAGIWVIVLVLLGYFIGANEALIKEYLHQIVIVTLGLIAVASMVYVYMYKKKQKQ
ncbi:DedA family protein [bacterium]|nr:DedA family protein [bacterium]MBU1957510.1 DedA family protein [bacterium]